MRRLMQFLAEALVAIVAAGLLLGSIVPLLSRYLEPLPRPLFHILVVVVLAGCVLVVTLRPGGALRR